MKKRIKNFRWAAGSMGMFLVICAIGGCGAGGASGAAQATTAVAAATTMAAGDEGREEAAEEEYYGNAEREAIAGDTPFWDYDDQSDDMGAARGEMADIADGISQKFQSAYKEERNDEEYHPIKENGFKRVADAPLSTFSIDVDTASYGNVRRLIRAGGSIPADAVRVEELINYFPYDYPKPKGDEPFSVTTEYADCPWNEEHRLLMIGIQAKEIDFADRPASNFVFLLDVSGSMYSDDKLPLVQKAFSLLAENLTEKDRVSIVTYAGYETVVLDGVPGNQKAKIVAALEDLEAGGSTAGEAGIEMAYALAEKNFIPGGNNRVILATDGDLNVGISSEEGLISLIEEKRKSGVHLSVLGVGTGNIKDNKMEALADNGDGNYNYLDSLYEAKKVLVDEMGGTLITVAKDVKIQVEFNPGYVEGYRLVGYENRLLRDEDFDNDEVDAGEIGAGHTVTALYEIIPGGGGSNLKYQEEKAPSDSTELLTVSLRYKAPNGNKSRLIEHPVEADSYREEMSENMAFASAVAEFGMVLRDSENKGKASFSQVMELAEPCVHHDSDGYRKEFLELVQEAAGNQGS